MSRTRSAVAAAAVALALLASANPASARTPASATEASVMRLYAAYFLRPADEGGLAYWVRQHAAGTGLAAISEAFAGSAEFRARYGSLSDADFVRLVYRNVLRRDPDSAGFAHWSSVLQRRASTRGIVMLGFSESPEFVAVSGISAPPAPSGSSAWPYPVAGPARSLGELVGTRYGATHPCTDLSIYWHTFTGFGRPTVVSVTWPSRFRDVHEVASTEILTNWSVFTRGGQDLPLQLRRAPSGDLEYRWLYAQARGQQPVCDGMR